VATNMIVELKQFFSQYDSLNLAFLDKDIFGLFNFPRDFDERLETAFKQRFESEKNTPPPSPKFVDVGC
ncbi:hypothetical protein, partial [Escherichia coli]